MNILRQHAASRVACCHGVVKRFYLYTARDDEMFRPLKQQALKYHSLNVSHLVIMSFAR